MELWHTLLLALAALRALASSDPYQALAIVIQAMSHVPERRFESPVNAMAANVDRFGLVIGYEPVCPADTTLGKGRESRIVWYGDRPNPGRGREDNRKTKYSGHRLEGVKGKHSQVFSPVMRNLSQVGDK